MSEAGSDSRSQLNCDAVTTKALACFIKSSQAEVFLQTCFQFEVKRDRTLNACIAEYLDVNCPREGAITLDKSTPFD